VNRRFTAPERCRGCGQWGELIGRYCGGCRWRSIVASWNREPAPEAMHRANLVPLLCAMKLLMLGGEA
jgi:hypothetical protein